MTPRSLLIGVLVAVGAALTINTPAQAASNCGKLRFGNSFYLENIKATNTSCSQARRVARAAFTNNTSRPLGYVCKHTAVPKADGSFGSRFTCRKSSAIVRWTENV